MRFDAAENFWLLGLVLVLGILGILLLRRKKEALSRFGDLPLVLKTAPDISFTRQRVKLFLYLTGLVFVVASLARLQFGTHMEMLKREGQDIIVAVDVSQSMAARDMAPNRLEKAKQELRGIIDRLRGDRIGLVAFAGEAFVQCPLTLDYSAAKFLLASLDHNAVSVQGTSISSAIEMATRSFDIQTKKHKVLVLLTDGEDHEGDIELFTEEARSQGVKIYTVGIGNPEGEPIPILDRAGNQVGFMKDPETGDVILSRLDENTLRRISLATGGKYYLATAGEIELDRIFEEIGAMEKKELEGTLVTHYDDRYQGPLILAILFLVGEFFLPARKRVNRRQIRA